MKNFIEQFKDFVLQGNVVEMVIGFTVGVAFKDSVSSFVDNLLMPVVGFVIGDVSFDQLYWTLGSQTYDNLAAAQQANAAVIQYGVFISDVIDLTIIAFTVFVMIKVMRKLHVLNDSEEK
jgi:large conductance mechanosensitive channel